ncbi:AAEL016986-PA [Aedes aegypti]|nr:AAEL016986-PA [Aedes aegypti]
MEEARYRSLGYFKHRQNMDNSNPNPEEAPVLPQKPPPRPLEEITCFKCGTKGHYANKCTKGHLAFLSNNAVRK